MSALVTICPQQTTTDAFADTAIHDNRDGLAPVSIVVANTGPSNGVSYQVLGSLNASATANEIQSVSIDAAGGHFHLTYSGQTTGEIAWNATAADVATALKALSNIGNDDVSVTGEAGGPYRVEFVGALGSASLPTMTTDATALTGGAGTALVAVVQEGVPRWHVAQSSANVAANAVAVSSLTAFWPFLKVQIKAQSAGNQTTAVVSFASASND